MKPSQPGTPEAAVQPVRPLRMVSYNIAHARGWMPHQGLVSAQGIRRNLDRIASLLRELQPDIVALQEIDADSIWNGSFDHVAYLREQVALPYAAFGASNDFTAARSLRLCYGNAILSRHPILLTEALRFGSRRVGEKGLLYVEIATPTVDCAVVSLHLHPSSRRVRLSQARQILELLARCQARRRRPLPLLVGGDFNCAPHAAGDAGRLLLESAGPLTGCHHAPVGQRTFPAIRPSRMLDYWLIPGKWRILAARAVRSRFSDHLPVLVEVQPEREGAAA